MERVVDRDLKKRFDPGLKKMQIRNLRSKIFFFLPIFILILVLIYYLYNSMVIKKRSPNSSPSRMEMGVDLKVEKPFIIGDKDGRKEWEIEADSILGSLESILTLKGLKIKYFPDEHNQFVARADTGKINNKSKDMEIVGNVVVTTEKYLLKTSILNWNGAEKKIETDAPVEIIGDRFSVKGQGLVADSNFNRIKIKKSVRAVIMEN